MVIVELIGSISLAIVFLSAVALTIIHIKNKQNDIVYIHEHPMNSIEQVDVKNNQLQEDIIQPSTVLPFQEVNQNISISSSSKTILNKEFSIINVVNNDELSSSPIKYGIQWTLPSNDDVHHEITNSPSNILKSSEFEQGDSLSLSEQTISVRNLIEKFENNSPSKPNPKEKNNQIDSDLTSIDTNFDNDTIKMDLNQNQKQLSYHSSISNLNVTIPSNLSSSIDLEKFECFSTTSSLSEFLNNN